jgi:uncharacterized membrane protein HdeD (DUF308 family)
MRASDRTGTQGDMGMSASPDPTSSSGQPDAARSTTSAGTRATVDQAAAITEELIDRGAPWSSRTTWQIVLGEGVAVVILGLLFIIKPLGGSSTTLQIAGLILLAGALITAFQLWKHKVRPDLELLAAFRAGSGITVGLVVVVSTILAAVTAAVTAALAVVIGIGFAIYGISGVVGTLTRREPDAPLPVAELAAASALGLAGVVLLFAGAGGSSTVDGLFNLLGVLLIAGGIALGGYAWVMRQQGATAS